ncbi:hypothetical protein [Shimia marina]|uniref:Secreted protein n=1 Tax=Shimia marina TaxID=321267 RepID=A0A0P1EVC9_9RHOB|nr:hypothetical protein [Shimia marina]CUH54423.1 hypothetical protein SHM7688_03894 [Shimia marina]SFE03392.1 hypothetical protein SAMN04488037_104301 [Shimia marina]
MRLARTGQGLVAVLLACLLAVPARPLLAQTAEVQGAQAGRAAAALPHLTRDRFWILWERVRYFGTHCPAGATCQELRSYSSRPLITNNTGYIFRLFGLQEGPDPESDVPKDQAGAPQVCQPDAARRMLGFDPLALPKSVKGEVLRGIEALHLDITGLKAPPGFGADFGRQLQGEFVSKLSAAGLRVVSKEELSRLPGQPVLNIYFSFSDPEDLCDYTYSVFASLAQDVLLVRDLRIKVAAGVWSYSTGNTAKDHQGTEADAIMRVVDALIQAHREVNTPSR